MRKPLIEPTQLVARINVTPIIDVALVLVIILLITAPMITALNMEIDLPQARTRSVEDEVRVSITLGKDGEVAVDDELIPRDVLLPMVTNRLTEEADKDILVVVRADANTSHGAVKDVIQDLRAAGAKRIAVATRQRGNGTR
jgi:biopolymer transport protein ExbD